MFLRLGDTEFADIPGLCFRLSNSGDVVVWEMVRNERNRILYQKTCDLRRNILSQISTIGLENYFLDLHILMSKQPKKRSD